MPDRKNDITSRPAVRKAAKRGATPANAATPLPQSMVAGKASAAKAALGDKPVFAYIASLPQPQRGIAEHVDALAAKTLPGLQRSVKWGMAYYGVGDGWCFSCGGFAGVSVRSSRLALLCRLDLRGEIPGQQLIHSIDRMFYDLLQVWRQRRYK